MTDSAQSASDWTPENFRTDVPHSARIYDYWLGGKEARSKEEIAAMFGGRELIDPGLVLVNYWRPDGEPVLDADRGWAYGGAAPL
jgi:S-adenosyl methyltransferase